ncbi:MAG: hypothetical protein JXB30_13580 [Anaerolineae bacterium]|nr:hypothetical protein [Anaerolineae bacterium]
MNEKRIRQVLGIEEQAQSIHQAAVHEAEQLQIQAEQDAQTLVEQVRSAAHEEARRLIEEAQTEEDRVQILTEAKQESRRIETLALSYFDRAVGYVLDQIAGKE